MVHNKIIQKNRQKFTLFHTDFKQTQQCFESIPETSAYKCNIVVFSYLAWIEESILKPKHTFFSFNRQKTVIRLSRHHYIKSNDPEQIQMNLRETTITYLMTIYFWQKCNHEAEKIYIYELIFFFQSLNHVHRIVRQ